MIKAPFYSEEGEQQGAVESMPLFTLSLIKPNNETNAELREHGGDLITGADDTYLIGPPEIVFPCLRRHKERVAKVGLNLQITKTKCHINAAHRSTAYHEHRGDIAEGYITNTNGQKCMGITVWHTGGVNTIH